MTTATLLLTKRYSICCREMVATAILIKNTSEGTRINRSLVEMIEGLPEGKYRIVIEPQSTIHSVPQRKLLFMWISLLARETGNTKVDIYNHFCRKFLLEDMPSVSKMSPCQLTHFMNEIEADVAQNLGFTLPVPSDGESFIEFIKDYKEK